MKLLSNYYLIIIFYLLLSSTFSLCAQEVEVRKGLSCGGIKFDTDPEDDSESSKSGKKKSDKSEILNFDERKKVKNLKKVVIERPRLIAKLKYLDEWTEDPQAIKKLLFFIDKHLGVSTFNASDGKELGLNQEQKNAIYDQLGELDVNFDEDDSQIPILNGDIPGVSGGDPVATFEIINNHQEQRADDFIVLFMSGHDNFKLDPKQIETLRSFIARGGFLFADSCCGQSGFEDGFQNLVQEMFPYRDFSLLDHSHPIYSTMFDLQQIRYSGAKKNKGGEPRLMGLQLGYRTAIIYSPDDLSCGWDGHMHGEAVEREIHPQDALKLGGNMVAYALGYRKIGSKLPLPKKAQSDINYDGTNVAWPQLKFNGDYDPDPFSLDYFIDWASSKINISFFPERIIVDASSDDLHHYPFLYLTGLGPIIFSEEEEKTIVNYLNQGGVLLVNACSGDKVFDQSFRDLMVKWFSNRNLESLPRSHPIFKNYFQINGVPYRPFGEKEVMKIHFSQDNDDTPIDWNQPFFEAIYSENKQIKVLYSPFDFACAWKGQPCLVCRGIAPKNEVSFKLGTNILLYLLE